MDSVLGGSVHNRGTCVCGVKGRWVGVMRTAWWREDVNL